MPQTGADAGQPIAMTASQTASGWVSGLGQQSTGRPWVGAPSPRAALAHAVLPHLRGPRPVFIAFSGGVDSSLLLAVAVDAARREGLALPIPVTNVFDQPGAADETSWQRIVLDHLGVADSWERVTVPSEDDLVGPRALPFLREAGVCWPMAHLVNLRATCAALPDDVVLLTGDGGDEAFGQRRITAVTHTLRRRRLDRPAVAGLARALAPATLRRWDLHRRSGAVADDLVWVRPRVRLELLSQLIDDAVKEPLRHAASTEYWMQREAVLLAQHNMRWLADRLGVHLDFPLWSWSLTRALQREGGYFGWETRGDIVKRMAQDLLPLELVTRTSKAVFNDVMFGPSTRQLVADWDGSGLDDAVIDVAALRREWMADVPHSGTAALLQQVALIMARSGP